MTWGQRLIRATPVVLLLVGLLLYKICVPTKDTYRLNQSEISTIREMIENGKIEVSQSGNVNKVEWDSLSSKELDLAFQTETIRTLFKDTYKNDSIDVNSQFMSKFAPPRLRRLIKAYQRNSIEERNIQTRRYNDSIQLPFSEPIQQEFQKIWNKPITTPKTLNKYLVNQRYYDSCILAEHSDILRPLIVTAMVDLDANGFRESFITYSKLLKTNDTLKIKDFREQWLGTVSVKVVDDVEKKILRGLKIPYLGFLDDE